MSATVKITNWSTDGNASIPAGTANIGKVVLAAGASAVGTIIINSGTANVMGTAHAILLTGAAVIGTANATILAGANNIGQIYTTADGGIFRYASVATTAQFASFVVTSSANAIIVTSVAAKKIVLIGAAIGGSPAMAVSFFSDATAVSGPISIVPGAYTLPNNRDGWMVTTAGQSLTVTPSVSGNFSGVVSYVVV